MSDRAGALGHFGDARRAAMGSTLVERVVETGSLVIRKLGGTRAREVAIHRFLSAPSVTCSEMIETLSERTVSACRGRRIVAVQDTTRLGAERLGKDPNVTAVLVEEADPQNWFIAGKRPAEAGLSAFWLDIKITAGTNTKVETTSFVLAAFTEMGELLGPLHKECYVFVHAADGDAYGYGGRTQNGRWATANPG